MDNSERKKTIVYIVIFCILVTMIAFTAPLLGGSPSSLGLGFILWGTAPLLVAILMRTVTRDWCDAGFKPAIKKNAWWYVISMLAFPVITVITIFLGEMMSLSSFSGFSFAPYLKTFLSALPIFCIFAIFEEFGWRGYLVPKLASTGINSYLASVIIAIVWTTWHLPYVRELTWVYSAEGLAVFIPRYYLALFVFAILYHEIRLITGSVWPAVLMHAITNAFGHPLVADYLSIAPGKDYLVSASGLFMIIFAGLLGVAINQWRVRKAGLSKLFT